MGIKQSITHHLVNIPGWHTRRKLFVVESDDWGSVRTPSQAAYHAMIAQGIPMDRCPFSRYDSLATTEDLEALFEVLRSVKDSKGRSARLTANCVMANPDFPKIAQSLRSVKGENLSVEQLYGLYHYEPFTETLSRYGNGFTHSIELWKQGMSEGLFHPQFHAREHLNVRHWMEALHRGDREITLAFDQQMWGLSQAVLPTTKESYMDAFASALPIDLRFFRRAIEEGMSIFESNFGFRSRSFIATRYTWSPLLEESLRENGIRYLQGMVQQKCPRPDGEGFSYRRTNFLGTKSSSGLTYLSRNVFFEPSLPVSFDWLTEAKRRIQLAFLWGKPAVVSTHRVNFIGVLDENNRTRNLQQMRLLLQWLVKEYPQVEFLSSDELGDMITNNQL